MNASFMPIKLVSLILVNKVLELSGFLSAKRSINKKFNNIKTYSNVTPTLYQSFTANNS